MLQRSAPKKQMMEQMFAFCVDDTSNISFRTSTSPTYGFNHFHNSEFWSSTTLRA